MARRSRKGTARSAFWRRHISKQKKSGKTEKSYYHTHALSYSTFRWWKKKLEDETVCLVQLKPEASARPPQRIEFIIPGMWTLVFSEEASCASVAQLIRTIREVWVFRGGGSSLLIVMYRYAPTRSGEAAGEVVQGYRGVIQSDAFSGYEALTGRMGQVVHAGCMAHARRHFVEAYRVTKSPLAQSVLAQIAKLYAVEEELRERECSAEEILHLRATKARPVLQALKERIEREAAHVPPKSVLGKALRYFLTHWEKLTVYCDYAFVPIDNNLVENAIRPFVVGRKNWLFSGSPQGAHASSIFYSIIETAKACGHEPYWYLRYLFERLPLAESNDAIRALLPYHVSPEDIVRTVDVNALLAKLTFSARR